MTIREYFEDQIKVTAPMTQDVIDELIRIRENSGVSTADLEHLQSGDRMLFYVLEGSTSMQVMRVFESELNTINDLEFDRWSTTRNTKMPVLRHPDVDLADDES